MQDITLVSHLQSMAGPLSPTPASQTGAGFSDMLEQAVSETSRAEVAADRAVEKFSTGESRNLHEVILSLEQADISMRLLVQMRNKILDAYQEIMRMQI